MFDLEDTTSLSLLFHLNSEPWMNTEAYRNAGYHQEFKQIEPCLGRTKLPRSAGSGVADLMRRRASCRAFRPDPMPLGSLAALLRAAYGLAEVARLADGTGYFRRSVPSAGGLFPLEIYLFVQRVEELANGVYHYDVCGDAVELVRRGEVFPELEPSLFMYPFVRNANVVIIHAAMFDRIQKKYGPRGYRYTLLEAGHSAQNICLAAVELGMGTLCMGGYTDSTLNRLLGLDPKHEGVVYTLAAGFADAG